MNTLVETSEQQQLPAIAPARLPYHPELEQRFGVTLHAWCALVDAVFPLAESAASIILALSYCKARGLDPFKRPVHIVPMYNSQLRRMVETVWPGIGELRTTAFRTGQYAGRDEASYGDTKRERVGTTELEFPEWCQVTVYRLLNGQRLPFPGPRVYWRESYAQVKRDDPSPNSMWRRRPFGQLDKCAEAAALRAAFPEEVGSEYAAEEMHGKAIGETIDQRTGEIIEPRRSLSERLDALAAPAQTAGPEANEEEAVETEATTPQGETDQAQTLADLDNMLGTAAEQGTEALQAAWARVPKEHQQTLKQAKDRRHKPTALRVDAAARNEERTTEEL